MFERRLFHSLFATDDQKEGMDAFLNKRAPKFSEQLSSGIGLAAQRREQDHVADARASR